MKKIYLTVLIAIFLFCFPSTLSAHSGRTDSSGGHNCYVGACAGTYHYHNGGSSGGYIPPKPVQLNMPFSKLSWEYEPNFQGTFTIEVDWDRPDDNQWSVGISKIKGADPGPLTDTTLSKYSFTNVEPGVWYINIKEGMPSGYWSNVSYWTITVPEWTIPTPEPTLLPTPIPTTQPEIQNDSSSTDSGLVIGLIIGGLCVAGIYSWSKSKS